MLYFLSSILIIYYFNFFTFTFYQFSTSSQAIKDLLNLSKNDIVTCNLAYKYLQDKANDPDTNTDFDTKQVENYYKVLNIFLSIVDIEKMYIPPHIDDSKGLFDNQLIIEKKITKTLNTNQNSKILDIGCGRGRIAHYVHSLTQSEIYGYNIDEVQIKNAINYADFKKKSHKLKFKVADHHKKLPYEDNYFDASYSYQALWPFLKKKELQHAASELFRVLKPGGIYSCSEYVITQDFDFKNPEHRNLHKLFLPTLAATKSNYPSDIVDELIKAGFEVITSKPSDAPTWTLTEQKTNLIILFKYIATFFSKIGIIYPELVTLIENLLKGGEAWKIAEKAKLADLNWQIVVKKPVSSNNWSF